MIKIKMLVDVNNGGSVRNEELETMIDETSFEKFSYEDGRRELDSWAKNFFPGAESIRIIYADRI